MALRAVSSMSAATGNYWRLS